MQGRWEDVEATMVAMAGADLAEGRPITPLLAAFAGDHLRFFAFLRPFAKGEHGDALVELLALAMPLDADRLGLSLSARVWSLDDPIPPVSAAGDLRQRALVCAFVDGTVGRPREETVFHPYDLVDGEVRWHPPQRLGGGQGFVLAAFVLAVRRRHQLRCDDAQILQQATRCVRLGHDLHLAPDVRARLAAGVGP